jgi:hypothetical protein
MQSSLPGPCPKPYVFDAAAARADPQRLHVDDTGELGDVLPRQRTKWRAHRSTLDASKARGKPGG